VTKLSLGGYTGARLAYINGTNNTFDTNGITVTSANSANAAIGGGIDLTNNTYSVNAYSPIISFSSLSLSTTYNNPYAGIWGVFRGAGGDSNWNTGDLVFGTALSYGINEKMRIRNDGNVGIGTSSPSTKLQIEDGYISTYHNINSNGGGYGVQFFTNGGGSKNTIASIDISQVGTARSGNMIFQTSDSGAPAERMRISSVGDLYLYNGSFQQQGVWTVFSTGLTTGTGTFNLDIGVNDEGGGGNIFKVEAGFAHYFAMSYNCLAEFYISTRGTGSEITDVKRVDTALAGSFTASKPSAAVLRVTKTAGNYGGGGRYWIKVTKVDY
jgi:hypothetical protein